MSEPKICDCANTGPDAINTCQRVVRGRVEPPCDCECHKPTQQQKCADLARAMGWTVERIANWRWEMRRPDGSAIPDPFGSGYPALFDSERAACLHLPNPYDSANDKDALVAWLAADRHRWERFAFKLFEYLGIWDSSFKLTDIAKTTMTTPRETIADAAWLAIQIDASPPPA